MKVFIINYNRLTLTKNMVNWVISKGLEPVILDNNSKYLPLLDWYKENPCKVFRFNRNFGHKVLWLNPVVFDALGVTGRYIVTDPDLDLSTIPDDFLTVLNEGLDKYPYAVKCGFSLEINNLLKTSVANDVIKWEKQFWEKPLDSVYFEAGIDTTFALYRSRKFSINRSIRTNRPYTAKHTPWYYDKLTSLPEDEQNYFKTANSSFSWKSKFIKNCVVSCYFTSVEDTQRGVKQEKDKSDYIEAWYQSLKNKNVNIVILHDGLSDSFIRKYPDITFEKVNHVPDGMILYDYRWHVGFEFLKKADIENVFFTDISDVVMVNNPFEQKEYKKGILFCGDEPCVIRENVWLRKSLENKNLMQLDKFLSLYDGYKRVVNPGVLGGDKKTVLSFLKIFTNWLTELKDRERDGIGDIMVFNYCVRTQTNNISKKYGFPVNSIFKKYEKRKDVWFKHK